MVTPPSNLAPRDPMDRAKALVELYDNLQMIRYGQRSNGSMGDKNNPGTGCLQHAINDITAQRQGDKSIIGQPWEQLHLQRGRLYHVLHKAAGLVEPDDQFEAELKVKNPKDPIHGVNPIIQLNKAKLIEENTDVLEIDEAIAAKLDEELYAVREELSKLKGALEAQQQALQEEFNKAKTPQERDELVKQAAAIQDQINLIQQQIPLLDKMQPPSRADRLRGKKGPFQKCINAVDEDCFAIHNRGLNRAKRDFVTGQGIGSRYNEETHTAYHLLMNAHNFQVISRVETDPNTLETRVGMNINSIPLFNRKGIRLAAASTLGAIYGSLLRGKPILKKDQKGEIVYQTEKNEDGTVKMGRDGKPIYKTVKGERVPEVQTDEKGKPMLEPYTEEEEDEIIANNPPAFEGLPTGYYQQTINYLMDLNEINLQMGGPGVFGFNPNAPEGQLPFDQKALEEATKGMNPAQRNAMMNDLQRNWKTHKRKAEEGYMRNVGLPCLHEAGKNDYRVAIIKLIKGQGILIKAKDKINIPPNIQPKDDPRDYTDEELKAIYDANTSLVDNKVEAMKKQKYSTSSDAQETAMLAQALRGRLTPDQQKRLNMRDARHFCYDKISSGADAPAQQVDVSNTESQPVHAAQINNDTAEQFGDSLRVSDGRAPAAALKLEEVKMLQSGDFNELPPGTYARVSVPNETDDDDLGNTTTAKGTNSLKQ